MTTSGSSATRVSAITFDRAAAAVGIAAALAAAAASVSDADAPLRAALCVVQACSLLLLMRSELGSGRGWVTGSFVVGAAWSALFLVPSVAYTIDPGLFDIRDLTGTLAVVTVGTTAFCGAYLLTRELGSAPERAAPVAVSSATVRRPRAVLGYAIGLLALAVIVANAGGPLEYLRSLNRTAGINAGLFYVIAALLLLRWVPVAIIAQRWGQGERPGRLVMTAFVLGTILLGATGARLFIVIAVLELAMLWSLLRRPIPTRVVLVGGLVIGLVIVFGLGTIKRYQSAKSLGTIGDQSFATYATTTAPKELGVAYVNNYVDTVRLVGLSRAVVPDLAPYETVRPLKELFLKPLPSAIRPDIGRSKTITFAFSTGPDTAYSVPIQATALLAGGPIVLFAISALLGWLTRLVDRRLLRAERIATWKLIMLVSLIIQIPLIIRSGIPNGVAVGLTDVIGAAATAWLILRRSGGEGGAPQAQPAAALEAAPATASGKGAPA